MIGRMGNYIVNCKENVLDLGCRVKLSLSKHSVSVDKFWEIANNQNIKNLFVDVHL